MSDKRAAWGKWGADDERGAVNAIGPEQVRRAAGLVRSGRVVPLGQPMSPKTPVPKHRAPMQHFMDRDGGDYAAGAKRPGGFQFAEDTVVMPLQFATHVDALCHAWTEDQLYNGFPSVATRSTTRATRCGIEKMGPIVARGVLLDVVRRSGAPLAMGATVSRAMLEAAAEQAGVAVGAGDAVLIRTGWIETKLDDPGFYDGEPGLDVEGAQWLAERGVAAIGVDNFAIEAIPFPAGQVFPVHQCVLRGYGVALIEGLMLEPLAREGVSEFLFVASPLPIVGGTGSPLAPVAVL
jgi:kynurenine formamidase